ncbi:MAG TPA: HAD hydrolase family protein, partial [Thermoanaerobaculales bacterium]|nr:HAD hydrolase family protein [Thermoanaerobaculales bacterium]
DGVLTDGTLVYGPEGEALKAFSVRDGLAIRILLDAGLSVALLSGRRSELVSARCRDLGIADGLVVQGSRDKAADLDGLERRLGLSDREVAVMGDDLPDVPMLERAGFAACPADAAPEVAAVCHMVCGVGGGRGAVREVAELLLKAQGRWQGQVGRWIGHDGGPKGCPQ